MVSAMAPRYLRSAVGVATCGLRHRQIPDPVSYAIDIVYRCRWRRRQARLGVAGVGDSISGWRQASVRGGRRRPVPYRWRPDIDTPSPPSPRSTGWTDRGVNVGLSGRGVPPSVHADAFGRDTRTQLAHNDASGPGSAGGSSRTRAACVQLGTGAPEPKRLALAITETPERPLTLVPWTGPDDAGVRHRAFGPRQQRPQRGRQRGRTDRGPSDHRADTQAVTAR